MSIAFKQGERIERGATIEVGAGVSLGQTADGRPSLDLAPGGSSVRLMDANSDGPASTLVFEGDAVTVLNGVATFRLGSLYAPAGHVHAWGEITGKPTTLGGYGITDGLTKAQTDAYYSQLGHAHSFESLTFKPTTLFGYGIADAYTAATSDSRFAFAAHFHDDRYHPLNGAIGDGQLSANIPRLNGAAVFFSESGGQGVRSNHLNSGTTGGISLHAGMDDVFGIHFRGQNHGSNWAGHGYVSGDWATYFTMSNSGDGRGWIFRAQNIGSGGPLGNVASISAAGRAAFSEVYASSISNGVQVGGARNAARGSIVNTPNLHIDSADGWRLYLNFYRQGSVNVGNIDQGAYALGVAGTGYFTTGLVVDGSVQGLLANATHGRAALTSSNAWGGSGTYYPSLGSTGDSLIMLSAPHLPFKASYGALLRMAANSAASVIWDAGLLGDYYMVRRNSGSPFLTLGAPGTWHFDRTDNWASDVPNDRYHFALRSAADTAKRLALGYSDGGAGNGFGFLASGRLGVAWTPLALQPSGGGVCINKTTVSAGLVLDVAGAASFSGSVIASGGHFGSAGLLDHNYAASIGGSLKVAGNLDVGNSILDAYGRAYISHILSTGTPAQSGNPNARPGTLWLQYQ